MAKEILSVNNQIVKDTVKLQQKKYRDKLILIEGKKAVDEAIKAGVEIKYIFSTTPCDYKNVEIFMTNEIVMKKISTTESPANVVAVGKKPEFDIKIFKKFKKITLLDNIKDAGNLGTIIRAAAAFNVDGIFLFNDTVDEFSPKVIRSSAGNIFKIPIKKINIKELEEFKKNFNFIATVVNSSKDFSEYKPEKNLVVMFGSEADGLCNKLVNLADEKLTIKMAHGVESLNLALCAGIVLYKLYENI